MHLGIFFTVLGVIYVAEIPDKTMIAMVIMGSRSRPVLVWIGASMAFVIHSVIAVALGRALEFLPKVWVQGVSSLLFAAGAAYLLFVPEVRAEAAGAQEAFEEAEAEKKRRSALWAAFAVILIGEFGDLTQILTANFAARYHQPLSVGLGAALALCGASATAAFGGKALVRVAPLAVIRKVGGVMLAGFAVYELVLLVR